MNRNVAITFLAPSCRSLYVCLKLNKLRALNFVVISGETKAVSAPKNHDHVLQSVMVYRLIPDGG